MSEKPAQTVRRRGHSAFTITLMVLLVYVASYFAVGKRQNPHLRVPIHREFSFDPWPYLPIAWIEYQLRGEKVDVRLTGSRSVYVFRPSGYWTNKSRE